MRVSRAFPEGLHFARPRPKAIERMRCAELNSPVGRTLVAGSDPGGCSMAGHNFVMISIDDMRTMNNWGHFTR